MLILTRKPGDTVTLGRSITLKVIEAGGRQVRIGIDAPKETRICRDGETNSIAADKRNVTVMLTRPG